MFGAEYADYPEVLLRQWSNLNLRIRILPVLKPLVKLYLRIFGVPEIGFYLRACHFKKVIKNLNFSSVLDAGCGLGNYTFYLARKHPRIKIDAWDYSIQNIEAAKKLLGQMSLDNINFSSRNLGDLSEVRKYDLICSIDVLEHIADDERVVKNFYKALKNQGQLILHLPRKNQKRHFKKFKDWSYNTHLREGYEKRVIIQLLENNGFETVRVKNTFGWFASLAWELNQISLSFLPFAAVLFPVLQLVSLLDLIVINKQGNGILIVARKLGK